MPWKINPLGQIVDMTARLFKRDKNTHPTSKKHPQKEIPKEFRKDTLTRQRFRDYIRHEEYKKLGVGHSHRTLLLPRRALRDIARTIAARDYKWNKSQYFAAAQDEREKAA